MNKIKLLFKMMFEDILLSLMEFVPDHLKKQEMCNEVMRNNPAAFYRIPDRLKTEEIGKEAVRREPWALGFVSDNFKTQEMYDDVVRDDPYSLQFVPDWSVKREGVDMCYDDYYDDMVIIGIMMTLLCGRNVIRNERLKKSQ